MLAIEERCEGDTETQWNHFKEGEEVDFWERI